MEHVDFSEVFTLAARQVAPAVLSKSRSFSFDYRGPSISLAIDVHRLQRTLHRLLCGAIDCLKSGFVMFLAEAEVDGDECRLTVTAAGAGQVAGGEVVGAVLERLEMHALPVTEPVAGARVAGGRCPITGAELEFACLPSDGMLLRATFRSADFEVVTDGRGTAGSSGPSRAWLVSSEDAAADSLTRRLQRLGWIVTRFDSCAHAQQHAATTGGRTRAPDLVIVFEFDGATPPSALQLRRALPAATRVAYSAATGSVSLSHPESLPGCEVHIHPFSPAELAAYTDAKRQDGTRRSLDTAISPLLFVERPLVLVVDDNELNRVVASALLESLGYDVAVARHGLEAIDRCRRIAPHAVLMDVEMPVLDGLGATRALRRLQRAGEISPCAIVAATSGDRATQQDRCMASGMDGFLSKPLQLPLLRAELRRVTLL
ncbi:MAG TPA: response regulator [Burkholderiaceae bacterium]